MTTPDPRDMHSIYVRYATALCVELEAEAVLVMVVKGQDGSGAGSASTTPAGMLELARALREMADYQEQHARDIMGRG